MAQKKAKKDHRNCGQERNQDQQAQENSTPTSMANTINSLAKNQNRPRKADQDLSKITYFYYKNKCHYANKCPDK